MEPGPPCPGHRCVQPPQGLQLPSEGLCPPPIKPQTSPDLGIWPGGSGVVGPYGAGCPRADPHRWRDTVWVLGESAPGATALWLPAVGRAMPSVSVLAHPQDKLLPNREQRGTCQEVYTHLGTGFSRCDSLCSTLTQLNQLLQLLVPGLGRSCLSIPSREDGRGFSIPGSCRAAAVPGLGTSRWHRAHSFTASNNRTPLQRAPVVAVACTDHCRALSDCPWWSQRRLGTTRGPGHSKMPTPRDAAAPPP